VPSRIAVRLLKLFLSQIIFIYSLYGGEAIVPGDEQYYKSKETSAEVIFTKQNRYAAEQAMLLEPMLNN
jgi:hypothetical protein